MVRPRNIDYVSLDAASSLVFEMCGVKRGKYTVYKWAKDGRIDGHGKMIKLRTVNKLGRLYTTKLWLHNFIKALG